MRPQHTSSPIFFGESSDENGKVLGKFLARKNVRFQQKKSSKFLFSISARSKLGVKKIISPPPLDGVCTERYLFDTDRAHVKLDSRVCQFIVSKFENQKQFREFIESILEKSVDYKGCCSHVKHFLKNKSDIKMLNHLSIKASKSN